MASTESRDDGTTAMSDAASSHRTSASRDGSAHGDPATSRDSAPADDAPARSGATSPGGTMSPGGAASPHRPSAPFAILPAIDLRGGRVVRLAQGDFDRETVYGDDPASVARRFAAAGARWIHVVDLDGAREGARRQTAAVAAIVEAAGNGVHCEVAGGLRDERAVEEALAAGAARVVVGTAALRDPAFAGQLVARFGATRVAVALDVRDGLAVGQGWLAGAAAVPVDDAMDELAERGIETFVVTAIDRDGLLGGPDLELLGRLVARERGAIVASGGVGSLDDLRTAREIGCLGAILGRALYEGRVDLAEAVAAFDR